MLALNVYIIHFLKLYYLVLRLREMLVLIWFFLASYKPETLDFYYSICFSTPLFCTIGLEVKKHEKSNLQ